MRILVGLDVAKELHRACAIEQDARPVFSRSVASDPAGIADMIGRIETLRADEVTIALDLLGGIATLVCAMVAEAGFRPVHTPGPSVNRARQGMRSGENKSDPRDARTIADLVRTRALRPILPDDETVTAIRLKVGRRRDLIEEQTRRICCLRGLLSSIHPGLERDLDVNCTGPLVLLTRYVTPAEIRQAGKRRIMAHLAKAPHVQGAEALADHALGAARAQMLAVPGEAAKAELVRELATEALEARVKIIRLDRDLAALLAVHPDGALIQSLPGMGGVLTAELIANIGDIRRFRSADALAAAARLPPILRQSGKSCAVRRANSGDEAFRRVSCQSAFVALATPGSRALHNPTRAEGQRHRQAMIALVRRPINVVWAMLTTRQPFAENFKAAA